MDLVSFVAIDAINYGLEEAVLLWHIKSAMTKSFYAGKNLYKEEIWIPLDLWEMKFAFPFWPQHKISKVLKSLIDQHVVKRKRVYEVRRGYSYTLAKQRDLE